MNAVSDATGPLAQLIDMGGPVMWVLLVLAVLGTVTFVYLMLFGALYAPRMTHPLRQLLGQWQAAPSDARPEQLRRQAGFFARRNPMMHLLVDSMTGCQSATPVTGVRETAARDAQSALEPFEGPLKLIEVIAALAPLLGLLGTVMGMMEAFSAMAATEGRANASQLSGGIYEALITTAAGLAVAIPFAALAAWIEFRLRRIHRTMNSALVSVFNVVSSGVARDKPMMEAAAPRNDSASGAEAYHTRDRKRLAHATG